MANPQAENGHVDISNEVMDALISHRVSGEEMQCLLFIIRKTWGWKKKEDRIALSQFVKATGINKQSCHRAIKRLESKKMIAVIKKDYENINSYCFIKDFEVWKSSSKKITVSSKKIKGVIKKDYQSSSKKMNTKDTITKDTITKDTKTLFVCPAFISPETWKDFTEHRKTLKSPLSKKACELIFKKLEAWKSGKGWNPDDILNQSIENGWKGVFELKNNGTKAEDINAWEQRQILRG